MLNDLKEIIAIKSVLSAAGENAPFGLGNRAALDWFLEKAKSYGLKTGELDGYCGWAEYGSGDECIAALCHLDVVPAGEGWTGDAFELREENARLYGRGVVDDKGPLIMCLHALKEIKDSKLKTSRRIRIIAGLNEEHGSACIKHYVRHGEIPVMSFVPDSEFPVINSEKGILHLGIRLPLDNFFEKNIAFIEGGKSINVVPDRASVSIFKDSELGLYFQKLSGAAVDKKIFSDPALVGAILASGAALDSLSIKNEASVFTVEASGIAGHAMAPEKADNAIWKIVTVLDAVSGASAILDFLKKYICTRHSAEKLGIYKKDDESGDITINIGIIEFDDDGNLRFTMDIRLPVSAKVEEVKKNISAVLPKGAKMDVLRYAPNLFIDKNDPLVRTLLEVYTDITGNDGYCLKTGGGTYARELPNSVAFGPLLAGTDGNLHKPDENISVEDFYRAAKIYKEAMIRLAK